MKDARPELLLKKKGICRKRNFNDYCEEKQENDCEDRFEQFEIIPTNKESVSATRKKPRESNN